MHSSTGQHYPGLDHLRALAACMVFAWHFMHGTSGYPLPFQSAPLPLLALWDEGHTGVALFMTLSGYLFARLTDGRAIHYGWFLYNRLLRLLPLLVCTFLAYAIWHASQSPSPADYLRQFSHQLALGLIYPLWPNGAWSIAVELQFYVLLPLLLALLRRSSLWLLGCLALALALRVYWHAEYGEVQRMAYLTLLGRIDQFLLGILAWHWRKHYVQRTHAVWLGLLGFMLLYAWFDQRGGFYGMPSYPSPSPIWIWLPTAEGVAYALLIGWYDHHAATHPLPPTASRFLSWVGSLSYSMYLLHFFVVFAIADALQHQLQALQHFYLALPVALICFAALLPLCWLSYRYIERPFLRYRKAYVLSPPESPDTVQRLSST